MGRAYKVKVAGQETRTGTTTDLEVQEVVANMSVSSLWSYGRQHGSYLNNHPSLNTPRKIWYSDNSHHCPISVHQQGSSRHQGQNRCWRLGLSEDQSVRKTIKYIEERGYRYRKNTSKAVARDAVRRFNVG